MKVIVGLGNPGTKYLWTRHNLGFMLIDALAEKDSFKNKHKSYIQKTEMEGEPVLLAKPQTFMNLSGQAVREILNFYKVPLEDLLVIHDDKDQVFGKIKFQKSRGDGGHNGIKNIHQELKSRDYCRLKMGIAPADTEAQEIWPNKSIKDGSPMGSIPIRSENFSSYRREKTEKLQPDRYKKELNLKPDTSQFVLSPFSQKEKQKLSDFLEQGRRAVHCFIQKGYTATSNQFNSRTL